MGEWLLSRRDRLAPSSGQVQKRLAGKGYVSLLQAWVRRDALPTMSLNAAFGRFFCSPPEAAKRERAGETNHQINAQRDQPYIDGVGLSA